MGKITPPLPAKRALAALDQPAPAPGADIGASKRISKKVVAAIDAMVAGGDIKTITQAAAKVGLARESLSRALSLPHVTEHLRQKVTPAPRHSCRPRRSHQGGLARLQQ